VRVVVVVIMVLDFWIEESVEWIRGVFHVVGIAGFFALSSRSRARGVMWCRNVTCTVISLVPRLQTASNDHKPSRRSEGGHKKRKKRQSPSLSPVKTTSFNQRTQEGTLS
jgi:hypothetical protein